MKRNITIPGTSLEMAPFGLGTLGAGVRFGKTAADADAIFGTYLDLGGNVIDTAHVYSDWLTIDGVHEIARSERVVGEWLRRSGLRDRIILMTKGGHPVMTSPDCDIHVNRLTRADMVKDLDESLAKLGVDCIDVYFYHRDDLRIPVEEMVETMQDFVRQGKIRYYAASNWSAERLEAAGRYAARQGYRGFVADQALLNAGLKHAGPMADDTLALAVGPLYDWHLAHPENLLVPYTAVCAGFFHKYLTLGEDAVRQSPYCTEPNLAFARRIPQLLDKYRAQDPACSVTNIVLGFFQTLPLATLPLFGPTTPESILEAARTWDIHFDPADFA